MDYSRAQQSRLFDKSTLQPRTISVYQIVGAYLTDIYYNHLFAEAHKFRGKGEVPTITEGYRHATFAFLSCLDHNAKSTYKAQQYKQLLIGINEYFKTWTSFNTLTVSDCIDKIVREFVPEDYFKQLDKEQKNNILRMVVTNTLREFTKIVIEEFLSAIVDNHDEPANIEALKERIIDLMISEREKMFHKFIASHFPASNETVDKKFAERMRDEITKLQGEVTQLKGTISTQREEIELRKDQLAKVLGRFRKLESIHKRLIEEYKVSKESISELEFQIQEYERNKPKVEDLQSSEFMDDNSQLSHKMDSFIEQHTHKPDAVGKVAVKAAIGTLEPALPVYHSDKPVKQATKVVKIAPKPAAKIVKMVPKPVVKPVVKVEESEESEEESEEEKPVAIPKIKTQPAVSITSIADPPKSPKASLGAAPTLSDAY